MFTTPNKFEAPGNARGLVRLHCGVEIVYLFLSIHHTSGLPNLAAYTTGNTHLAVYGSDETKENNR
jgi:Zn-dependent metalloprotease